MKVSILSSGSEGNSLYIEGERQRILLDAGLSGKKIEERMKSIDREMKDIDAIFVTHEHSDHIKGLGVLAKRYGCDLYANEKTWHEILEKYPKIPKEQICCIEAGEVKLLEDLEIEAFPVSHDTVDPQFYMVRQGDKSFVELTDTGYCSERLYQQLGNANMYLMETNHDVNMLRFGPYPWHLKQRILGDTGHLSNEDGAYALGEMIGNQTKNVFLGHLSPKNNMPQLAREVVIDYLTKKDIPIQNGIQLHDTSPVQASPLIEVI